MYRCLVRPLTNGPEIGDDKDANELAPSVPAAVIGRFTDNSDITNVLVSQVSKARTTVMDGAMNLVSAEGIEPSTY